MFGHVNTQHLLFNPDLRTEPSLGFATGGAVCGSDAADAAVGAESVESVGNTSS